MSKSNSMTDHGETEHGGPSEHGPKPNAGGVSNLVFFGDSLTDNGNLFAAYGIPQPPYWDGRFSNGPTYAETLPGLLGVAAGNVQNYAFGGARAVRTGPTDLDTQVATYLANLGGSPAPKGTEAVLYIGNNDFLNYTPTAANPPPAEIAMIMAHIQGAIQQLHAVGVDKIVLFTLPDFSITPAGQALATTNPALVAGADALINASNDALKALAAADNAAGIHVTIVDATILGNAVSADGHAFGLQDTSIPIYNDGTGMLTGITQVLAPNEIAFFDSIHPTHATHDIQAEFAAATLNADHVQLYAGSGHTYAGTSGADFIFSVGGSNNFSGGAGNDIIYTGNGNSTAHGGAGNDLIFAGGGNNHLFGDSGSDLLAVNSGTNWLTGGSGFDVLIANRAGTTTIDTGGGDNLIIFKENAGASFGQQTVFGGHGDNTLRFIINDQNPLAEQGLITEFQHIVDAYNASLLTNHHGTFSVDGLNVQGITGLQLQLDSVDTTVPYQIDHTIVQSIGHGPELSSASQQLLQQASLWGLLTV